MQTISRHAEVLAVLTDPSFEVPEPAGAGGGLGWLRATVSRFSNGEPHQRRRALVQTELDRMDPAELRRRAYERAREADLDLPTLARAAPVGVLAEALGVPDPEVVEDVLTVARVYLPADTPATPAVDAAVDRLVKALGGADDATAARMCLLVQACEATAGLILAALPVAANAGAPVDAVLVETLRHDPPVRALRRERGSPVRLDVAAANRDPAVFADPDRFDPGRADADRHLTFGAGVRRCPGSAHALALAAGVVEAVAS